MSLFDSFVAAMLPITPKFIVGKVARRYIAGETLEDAVNTIRTLNQVGARCTVDVLGEFIHSFDEAVTTAGGYETLLRRIDEESLDSNVSVKLTALGLLIDEERCTDLVRNIAKKAQARGNFVRVDMEDSPVTDMTLNLVRRLRGEGLPVGAVLQAYLHRTEDDAKALAREGIPVRLCKGIYKEPEEIAFQDREAIRDSYRRSLRALLEGQGGVAIATHDDVLVEDAKKMVEELKPERDRYEYQMLLGVREWLRDELIETNEKVRIYVPYGEAWYGYSKRRLRENPQIAGHVFKAMFGFDKAKKKPAA